MDIRNTKQLHSFARQRLENAPQARRIVLIYSAVVLGLAGASTLINFLLDHQIAQTSGLSSMGTRSVLSAISTMLPMIQSLVSMCMGLGYLSAMLRIARGQYASPNGLRLGFARFFPLLRLSLLKGLLLAGISLAAIYLSTYLFLLFPASQSITDLLLPMTAITTQAEMDAFLTPELLSQLSQAIMPIVWISGILILAAAVPVFYRYRMAEFVLIDKPALGAFAVLRESRHMMRRRCLQLFRLDLRLWWYYAGGLISQLFFYLPELCDLLRLPLNAESLTYPGYCLYLVSQFLLHLFLRNQVEVTYALAYDAIRPQEQPHSGVVLGNIFQM